MQFVVLSYRRMVMVLLLALLACLASVARGAAPGTVPDVTWHTSKADIDRTVALMQQAGVQWARTNVPWNSLEPEGNGQLTTQWLEHFNYDYAIGKLHQAGIAVVMPMADSVPYWASGDPAKYVDGDGKKHWNQYYKPYDISDYADAFEFLVSHYSQLGVHVYEVWNEPNISRFWPSGPSAGEYTQMLKAAYPAIKKADPSATVLLGGLAQNDYNFLSGVYANGGRPFFDALGNHVYPKKDPALCWSDAKNGRLSRDALCGIEEMRRVMVANGDAAKSMWLTEFGFATCDNAYPECWNMGVNEAQQADYLLTSYFAFESYPWLHSVFWYNFRNNYWQADSTTDFEAATGLLRTGFSAKPAYWAYRDYALGLASSPALQGASLEKEGRRITLRVETLRVFRRYVRLQLSGRASGTGGIRVVIQKPGRRGGWQTARKLVTRLNSAGMFSRRVLVPRARGPLRRRARAVYSSGIEGTKQTGASEFRYFRIPKSR